MGSNIPALQLLARILDPATLVTVVATTAWIRVFRRGLVASRIGAERNRYPISTTQVELDADRLTIGGDVYRCAAGIARGDAKALVEVSRLCRSAASSLDWANLVPCPNCGHKNPSGRTGCGGCGQAMPTHLA